MNILTLARFVVMGLTLALNRMGQAGKLLSIGLMGAGTALVFVGLYDLDPVLSSRAGPVRLFNNASSFNRASRIAPIS
jgi:hypothetical protein